MRIGLEMKLGMALEKSLEMGLVCVLGTGVGMRLEKGEHVGIGLEIWLVLGLRMGCRLGWTRGKVWP